jgi:uncharacterized protein (DUF433 family)
MMRLRTGANRVFCTTKGMTYEEILEDFPYLTQTDILACLAFAANRERIMLSVTP